MKPAVKTILIFATAVLSLGFGTVAVTSDDAFRAGPGGLRIKDLQVGLGRAQYRRRITG